jgi:membrane-bound ClpP family serine protease
MPAPCLFEASVGSLPEPAWLAHGRPQDRGSRLRCGAMALIVAVALAVLVLPSPWGIIAIFVGIVVEVGEQAFWFRYQAKRRVRTGVEGHVGERAEVVRACDPEGRVRFRGEVWRARSAQPAAVGETVRVLDTEGLTLVVERDPDPNGEPGRPAGPG